MNKINYKKLSIREHVRLRTGMYLGSNIPQICNDWIIYNNDNELKIIKEDLEYPPAIYKAIDEIIVNAIDHYTRTQNENDKCNIIKCNFNKETGEISIYNNGTGIEVLKYEKEDYYIPEMIFSHAMTGSNFKDDENKITGGLNGLGSKCTNFVSEYFIVETLDTINKKTYYQKFDNGSLIINKPIIKNTIKKSGMTKITFKLDFNLFYKDMGYTQKIGEILEKIIRTRMYYVSIFCKNSNIYYNDEKIKINKLEQIAQILIPDKNNLIITQLQSSNNNDYNWDIIIGINNLESTQNQISIINGICVKSGGTHIKYIQKLITDNLKTKLEKLMKNNKSKTNNKIILDNIFIFMTGNITNPDWKGQQKDELNVNISKFKNYKFNDNVYIKIWNKLKSLLEIIYLNIEENNLKKTNGTKKKQVIIPNLYDAEMAGTKESYKCRLFLTEGLSASTYAIAGFSKIGRKYNGSFALKGKVLNVRDQSNTKINNNKEITYIKEIVGLKHGHIYTSLNELRYGKIVILADQDLDGSHIKSLIMNMIHSFWPELIELGFVCSFSTPIVKATKGNKTIEFFTISEFNTWKMSNNGWTFKYFKGLGTSTQKEAKDSFDNFDNKLITYIMDENANKSINLGFNKTMSDDRKKWLLNYNKDNIITQSEKEIKISDLINKELIHFSYYDMHRSIPSLIDGLKPTQRKIIYTGFKYIPNNIKEVKVAQFGAKVAEKTCYHHGEKSIFDTIINMAQDYIGSNNMNLLLPNGNFGSRLSSGEDHSSERYIFTNIHPITKLLFKKDDEYILNYLNEEGQSIEPDYYLPVLPNILINGTKGIGTGFSTEILQHNIKDIAKYIINKLNNEKLPKIKPYYRFFKGKIKPISNNIYNVYGLYEFNDSDCSIIITELPIGTWTNKYKIFIESLLINNKQITDKNKQKLQCIKEYSDTLSTIVSVHFKLYFTNDIYKELKSKTSEQIYKQFKLVSTLSENNMHLFDEFGNIHKYETVYEILDYFYNFRLIKYKERKDYILSKLELEMNILKNKVKFINNINNNKLNIIKIKDSDLIKQLDDMGFDKFKINNQDDYNYNYLINMQIKILTNENANKLNNEFLLKETEYNILFNTDIKDIWKSDINNLLHEYNIYNNILEKNNKDLE